MRDPPQNELEIFANAPEDATPEELVVYLDEACGEDDILRAEVETLIAMEGQEGSFMRTRPIDDATLMSRERPSRSNVECLVRLGLSGSGSERETSTTLGEALAETLGENGSLDPREVLLVQVLAGKPRN